MSSGYITIKATTNSDVISALQMSLNKFKHNFDEDSLVSPEHFSGAITIYYGDEDLDEDGFDGIYNGDAEFFAGILNFHAYNLTEYGFSVFDEDTIFDLDYMYETMDAEDGDEESYFVVMNNLLPKVMRKMAKKEENLLIVSEDNEWLITLDRFYIEKKYRGKGIGNYILRNLYDILKTAYHINAVFLCGACIPDKEEDIVEKEMIEIQKKPLKQFKYIEFNKKKNVDNDMKNTFCGCIHPDVS